MLLTLLRRAFRRHGRPAELNAAGVAHYQRGELESAERCFREAARHAPQDLEIWNHLAAVLLHQKKHGAALPVVAHLVELAPERAVAHFDLGTCYNRIGRNREAIAAYETALALQPDLHAAHAHVVNAYLDGCEWDAVERWLASFHAFRACAPPEVWTRRMQPFAALTLAPGAVAKEVARMAAARISTSVERGSTPTGARAGRKIRVAYVSSDFNNHAAAQLTYELYERHSRRQFEVYGYSIGPDDGSRYRKHIERTCDHFFDAWQETDERTAARIRNDGIDILVDLNGHSDRNRMRVFAHRPAPVQVNYIYPGTSGADFLDYFISDSIATPPGCEDEFTERVVYMPDSYFISHGNHPVAAGVTREQCGLPEDRFVYCDFNSARKIDRRIFAVWMSILRRVPASVLWLVKPGELAEANLRKYARTCGVDPARIVFADPASMAVYLARLRLADLFLDTLVYNAHTGASDALSAGLPVLTCPGRTLATRVAASILHAAGMDDLAVRDMEAYEELAVALANRPQRLSELKLRLAKTRRTCALFDTSRFVRNLEAAYVRMHEMRLRGEAPASFKVQG